MHAGNAFRDLATILLWAGAALASLLFATVVAERTLVALARWRHRGLAERYGGLVREALAGSEPAQRRLAALPARHREVVATLLIEPLIADRDPERIVRTRSIVHAIVPVSDVHVMLDSRRSWRRALALRAIGLVQDRAHAAAVVQALDDPHPNVRAAALDALADLKDPATLQALVVRLQDPSLPRGRRAAALLALADECEPFVLDLAAVDRERHANYARVLSICGTARSRPALCAWAEGDPRPEVKSTALAALRHVGLDDRAAAIAITLLEHADPAVRAAAADALHGWEGSGHAAAQLARHLGDTWIVAVRAARSLQAMPGAGLAELRAASAGVDTAGLLARQMLWEEGHR